MHGKPAVTCNNANLQSKVAQACTAGAAPASGASAPSARQLSALDAQSLLVQSKACVFAASEFRNRRLLRRLHGSLGNPVNHLRIAIRGESDVNCRGRRPCAAAGSVPVGAANPRCSAAHCLNTGRSGASACRSLAFWSPENTFRRHPAAAAAAADRSAHLERLDPHTAAQVGGGPRPPDRPAQCHRRGLQVCQLGRASGKLEVPQSGRPLGCPCLLARPECALSGA